MVSTRILIACVLLVSSAILAGSASSTTSTTSTTSGGKPATSVSFVQVHERVDVDASDQATTHTTFRSQAMPLAPGEVVFTQIADTPLVMPAGPIAITGFSAEVIDDRNVSVPLTEVYNHHWLVFNSRSNEGMCQPFPSNSGFLRYVFGVGAESRGTPVQFPAPYAYVTTGAETWNANIHLLRTTDLLPAVSTGGQEGAGSGGYSYGGYKGCAECLWSPFKEQRSFGACQQQNSGTFACCQTGSFCETNTTAAAGGGGAAGNTKKTYYLSYTVSYTAVTSAVVPLKIYLLDASDQGQGCQIDYNVPSAEFPVDPANNSVVKTRATWTMPDNFVPSRIVTAIGHLHIGGKQITLSHAAAAAAAAATATAAANGGTGGGDAQLTTVCTSVPSYGTDPNNAAGNERGYLVAISSCAAGGPELGPAGFNIGPGDTLQVDSEYSVDVNDTTALPNFPGGSHGGVMSLVYFAVAEGLAPNASSSGNAPSPSPTPSPVPASSASSPSPAAAARSSPSPATDGSSPSPAAAIPGPAPAPARAPAPALAPAPSATGPGPSPGAPSNSKPQHAGIFDGGNAPLMGRPAWQDALIVFAVLGALGVAGGLAFRRYRKWRDRNRGALDYSSL